MATAILAMIDDSSVLCYENEMKANYALFDALLASVHWLASTVSVLECFLTTTALQDIVLCSLLETLVQSQAATFSSATLNVSTFRVDEFYAIEQIPGFEASYLVERGCTQVLSVNLGRWQTLNLKGVMRDQTVPCFYGFKYLRKVTNQREPVVNLVYNSSYIYGACYWDPKIFWR